MASPTYTQPGQQTPQGSPRPQQYIEDQLQRTREQVKTIELTSELLLLASLVIGYVFTVVVLDHWVFSQGLGFWARLMAWSGLVLGSGYLLWARVLPLLVRKINPVYAAAAIEQREPNLKNSLINFLMFRSHPGTAPEVVLNALEQRAATDLSQVSVEGIIDRSKMMRLLYVLVGLVVVLCAYSLLSPKDPFQSVSRLVMPWSNVEAPTRVTIKDVRPGSTQKYAGEYVEVSAHVKGLAPEDEVTLYFSTDDGSIRDEAIEMVRPDGEIEYKASFPRGDGLGQNVSYYVAAGDVRTPLYRVDVQPAPTISVDKIEYHYPEYTGLSPHSQPYGNIEALEGTEITFYASTNQDIDPLNCYVDFNCNHNNPMLRLRGGERSVSGNFTLSAQSDYESYWLRFNNTDGMKNPFPIRYSIKVIPDEAPTIQFVNLQDETEVPMNSFVPLKLKAKDPDFALKQIHLRLQRNGRDLLKSEQRELLSKPHKGEFRGQFEFAPERFDLAAGDIIKVWAEAVDVKEPNPNRTKTAEYTVKITKPDPLADQPQPDQLADAGDQQQRQQNRDPQNPEQDQPQQPGENDPNAPQDPNQERQEGQRNGEPQQAGQGQQQDQPQEGQEPPPPQNDGERFERLLEGLEKRKQEEQQQPGEQQPQPGEGGQQQGNEQPQNQPDQQQPGEENRQDPQQGEQRPGESGQPNQNPMPGEGQKQPEEQPQQQPGNQQQESGKEPGSEQRSGENQPQEGKQPGKESQPGENQPGEQQPGENQPDQQPKSGDPSQQQNARDPNQQDPKQGGQPQQGETGQKQPGENQQPGEAPMGQGDQPQQKPDPMQQPGEQGSGQPENGSQGSNEQPMPGESGGEGQKPDNAQPGSEAANQGGTEKSEPGSGEPGQRSEPAGGQREPGAGESEKPNTQQAENPMGQGDRSAGSKQDPDAMPGEGGQKPEAKGGDLDNQKGDAGEGESNMNDNQGTPSPQGESRQVDKQPGENEEGSQAKRGDNPKSPSNSDRESDSKGGKDQGDKSGGGQEGGGQRANEEGTGTGGSNTESREGQNRSPQPGEGETGNDAGEQQISDRKTGNSSEKTPGEGSKSRPGGERQPADQQRPGEEKRGTPEQRPDQGEPQQGDPQQQPNANQPNQQPRPGDKMSPDDQAGERIKPNENADPQNRPGSGGQPQPGNPPAQPNGQSNEGPVTQGGNANQPARQGREGQDGSHSPGSDQANKEFAKQQVEFVLDKLDNELNQENVDPEVLKQGGFDSKAEAQAWVEKWKKYLEQSRSSANDQERFEKRLKGLGLKPRSSNIGRSSDSSDSLENLQEGFRVPPPEEYREQAEAYKNAIRKLVPTE